MKNIFLLLGVLMIAYSCSSQKKRNPQIKQDDLPVCIKELIKKLLTKSEAGFYTNCPGDIYSYLYNGKTVYFIPAQSRTACDDVSSTLYDSNCNQIALYGGYDGKGDGREKDFFKKRTNEKLIWKFDEKLLQ